MEDMLFTDNAEKTNDIEDCANKGCGFNVEGKCKANGTECFGFMEVK
jgi:hypothetical protein